MPIPAESTTTPPAPTRSATEAVIETTFETGAPLLLSLTGVGLPAGVAVGPIIHWLFGAYDRAVAQYPDLTHQEIVNLLKHEALTLDPKVEIETAEREVGLR